MQEHQKEIEETIGETIGKLEKYIARLNDLEEGMVESKEFFKGIDLNLPEEIGETKIFKELIVLLLRANAVAARSDIRSFLNSVVFIKEGLEDSIKELSKIKSEIK